MSNPSPSPETRWAKGTNPRPKGRPNRAWIRKIVNESNPDGQTEREQILRHQIEVAKSWDVKIVGRDSDGAPIKVASGRDSTEAAKFIYGLIGLRPLQQGDDQVGLPPGLVTEGRSLLAIAMDIYRHRLMTGQMTDAELSDMVRTLLAAEKDKALLFLKALGPKLQAMQAEKVQQLQADFEANPAKFLGLEPKDAPVSDVPDVLPPGVARPEFANPATADPFEGDDDDSI